MYKVHNIIRLDSIRLTKLTEIIQLSLLGFFIGYIVGGLVNNYLLITYNKENYITGVYKDKKNNKNPKLILHIVWDLTMIVIATYYLQKITILFPFLPTILGLCPKTYVANKKEEGKIGFTIGLGFIFSRELYNLTKKIDLFIDNNLLQE
jgi:hypothetical protein